MGWGVLLRPTVLLGIALALASLGLFVERTRGNAARAERDAAVLRADTAEASLKTALAANEAQGRTIKALEAAVNEWAAKATATEANGRAAAKRAAARQADTDRAMRAITDQLAAYVRKPECERLMAVDLEAVCAAP